MVRCAFVVVYCCLLIFVLCLTTRLRTVEPGLSRHHALALLFWFVQMWRRGRRGQGPTRRQLGSIWWPTTRVSPILTTPTTFRRPGSVFHHTLVSVALLLWVSHCEARVAWMVTLPIPSAKIGVVHGFFFPSCHMVRTEIVQAVLYDDRCSDSRRRVCSYGLHRTGRRLKGGRGCARLSLLFVVGM